MKIYLQLFEHHEGRLAVVDRNGQPNGDLFKKLMLALDNPTETLRHDVSQFRVAFSGDRQDVPDVQRLTPTAFFLNAAFYKRMGQFLDNDSLFPLNSEDGEFYIYEIPELDILDSENSLLKVPMRLFAHHVIKGFKEITAGHAPIAGNLVSEVMEQHKKVDSWGDDKLLSGLHIFSPKIDQLRVCASRGIFVIRVPGVVLKTLCADTFRDLFQYHNLKGMSFQLLWDGNNPDFQPENIRPDQWVLFKEWLEHSKNKR
jgi:hypothetical protein